MLNLNQKESSMRRNLTIKQAPVILHGKKSFEYHVLIGERYNVSNPTFECWKWEYGYNND